MSNKFLPLFVTFSLLSLAACKDTPQASGPVKPPTAEDAEAARQRQDLQKRLEANRGVEERARAKRAEEARLAAGADKAAAAKAADAAKPAGLKEPVTLLAEDKLKLPESGKKVIAHLRLKEEVPSDLLTQAFLDLHFAQRQPAHPDAVRFEAFARSIEPALADTVNDPGNLKRLLEQKVSEEFSLTEIQYDKDKVNLLDAFNGYTQCYSGTALYTVFYRRAAKTAGDRYKDQFPVIVFTKGHVYPGYFRRLENRWVLFQVETTQAGSGLIRVGGSEELKTQAIRVTLVNDFLISDLLKHAAVPAELEKFKVAALSRTATAFDLPLAEMEAQVKKAETGGVIEPAKLNSGIFAFGKSEETAGAKPRVYSRALSATVAKVTHTVPETRRELNPKWKVGESPGYQYVDVPTGKNRSYETDAAPSIFAKILDGDETAVKKYLADKGTPDLYTDQSFRNAKGDLYVFESTLLGAAIRGKQPTILKLLLDAGADPFAHGSGGFTEKAPAILFAIDEKDYGALKQIAGHVKHVDVRLASHYSKYKVATCTALAYAVEKNDSEAVKVLLAARANPLAVLDKDYTVRDHASSLKRDFKIGAPVADQLK